MIWGLALEPGNEYTRTSEDEVHLSLATIESRAECDKAGSYSQVVLKTEESEQLLCTLVYGTIFQQCLDLKLMAGERVTFSVQGSCTVYITGYSFRSPLEPASEVQDPEETMETSNMTSYGEEPPYIKMEPATSEEDYSTEEQTVKDEVEEDPPRSPPPVTDDSAEQGVDDDGFLPEDQQIDEAAAQSSLCNSSDTHPGHHRESGQAPQGIGKTAEISDEMIPADGSQKETSLPGPSSSTAQTKNMIELGSVAVHLGENGSSGGEKKMNAESPSSGGNNNMTTTTDTSNRIKNEPTSPIAGKDAGSSGNVEVGPVSDQSGQSSKVTNTATAVLPRSQSQSLGVTNQSLSPDDKYVCPLCSEAFPGKDSLLVHEQKHAREGKMFSCRYCHMVFLQKGNRNIHERIHSAMRHNFRAAYKNQNDIKERSRKALLDDAMQEVKPADDKPKSSALVGSPLATPQRHKPSQSHHHRRERPETTKSTVRSRPYPHYSGLGLRAAHQPHFEDKNYRCQFCEKPFKRNYDRNRHERIHTGQKPYQCSYCDQAFSRREHCKKHEFTHLRSRPCSDLDQ